jgi:outer membrane protein TolC
MAVHEGLDHSPSAKRYESAQDEARWERNLGLSGLMPKIDFMAGHAFSTKYESVPVNLGGLTAAVPIVMPRTAYGVEAQWTVFDGFANIHHYEASLDLYRASEQESSRENFEVRKKIQLQFYAALAAQKFEEVAEENLKTLTENMNQVRFREQGGVATKYDVLRVEVQLSDAKTEVERTQDNVVIERRRLAQVMGLAEDSRALVGNLPIPSVSMSESIQNLPSPDPTERQDFRAAQLRSIAAEKESKAALGALVPSVSFAAQYEKYDNTDYPSQAYGGFRDSWTVGLAARWTILDGGASISLAGIERARAAKAQHEYQEVVLTLPADFTLWRRRYAYSAHRYESKKNDLTRSEESFRISTVSFQQGRKTITDVLEAETDLFRARAGVVQSQLDGEESLVNLELTLGKDI